MRELDEDTGRLLDMVKRKCSVTWDAEATDLKLLEIVEESILAIRDKLGIPEELVPSDILKPGSARELFKAYALYKWNDCEDEFDGRYLGQIMQARREYTVAEMRSSGAVSQCDTGGGCGNG